MLALSSGSLIYFATHLRQPPLRSNLNRYPSQLPQPATAEPSPSPSPAHQAVYTAPHAPEKPLPAERISQVRQAATQHQSTITMTLTDDQAVWVAPILLRGETVGHLQLHHDDPQRTWTRVELAFIEAVINQVAQRAESLSLLDELATQAWQQKLTAQIGNRLRNAPDVDRLMEITVEELSRALEAKRTFIELNGTLDDPPADETSHNEPRD